MWKFEDARMPTDTERERLARLMYLAFCDLRILAREERSAQAKSLADAFHNIPLLMYSSEFSFSAFRGFLERCQKQYEGKPLFNYLKEWEELNAERSVP